MTALGERGEDVSSQIVDVGSRAIQTIDQQMAGLTALLTRRTDELIAAVNRSAADPVRALGALSAELRTEVANSSETLRNVAEQATQLSTDSIDSLFRRVTEQVEASGVSLREAVSEAPRLPSARWREPATGSATN